MATHKGWDFRNNCTEFILLFYIYDSSCNCKLVFLFYVSWNKPLHNYIQVVFTISSSVDNTVSHPSWSNIINFIYYCCKPSIAWQLNFHHNNQPTSLLPSSPIKIWGKSVRGFLNYRSDIQTDKQTTFFTLYK